MPQLTPRQDRLLSFFEVLENHPMVGSYEERLLVQKTVCFYKYAGIPFNYSFNWYINGPYSPALASDAFELNENKDAGTQLQFEPNEIEKITKINTAFKTVFTTARIAELYASLVFLRYENKISDKEKLKQLLLVLKPKYASEEFTSAVANIAESGFFADF